MEQLTKKQKQRIRRIERRLRPYEPIDNRIIIHRADGTYDSENHVWLLNATTEKEVESILWDQPLHGLEIRSAYDCTGKPFCEPATIRKVTPERYIVRLHVNYDV
jgi:hypothetical protein